MPGASDGLAPVWVGHPVGELVDEAIEEARRQQVRVVIVPDCMGAGAVDGLATALRFR